MIISLIAAMAENRVIGRKNGIPWDFPEDRRRFRLLTMGHPVLMGRKTFDSLPVALDGRTVIVLSRDSLLPFSGALLARSLEEALYLAAHSPGGEELFIAGGGELYRQALLLADRIYLTIIHRTISGDITFPELPAGRFTEMSREKLPGTMAASFIRLEHAQKTVPILEV
jgi:dihydrofolate reductase